MERNNRYCSLQAVPLKLISDLSQFVGPVFLSLLLGVVEEDKPKRLGFIYASKRNLQQIAIVTNISECVVYLH